MQSRFTLLFSLLFALNLSAQDTITFENFDLMEESFLNDAGDGGVFTAGGLLLPNDYNAEFNSFTGWAISTTTDTENPSFTNQYSAITGSGVDGSEHYAISFGTNNQVQLSQAAQGKTLDGMFITNTTYAYRTILDGNQFSKKFGGETGDDPDFFLLTIKKYLDGQLGADSINFYLADYRFADNSLDYVVDEWTFVDLSTLGAVDSLEFTLTGSDVGDFGLNTPAYFALDNFTADGIGLVSSVLDPAIALDLSIYPNPTTEVLNINWGQEAATLRLFDMNGRQLQMATLNRGDNRLDVSQLGIGFYTVSVTTATGIGSVLFYKK